MAGQPKEIRSLNTIRGVAALMVAAYHAPALFGLQQTLPHAYLAVDLFFVLSGFVMMHAYQRRIVTGMPLGRFVQLRLARLYPLLFLATLAGFALLALKGLTGRAEFGWLTALALPANLLLLPAPAGASANHAAFPFLVQSWSIVWEILLCLALFAWLKALRRHAGLIALAAAVPLALVAFKAGGLDGGWTTTTFWVGGLRALFAFAAGVAVFGFVNGRGPLPRIVIRAAVVGAIGVLIYACLVRQTFWWADLAAVTIVFPLVLAAAAGARHALLENRLGDALGEASYSVYLLHGLTIDVLLIGLKAVHLPPVAQFGFGLAWLLALPAASWICWRWIETPMRQRFSGPSMSVRLRRRIDLIAQGA